MLPLSILDLAPVAEGSTPADTFAHMRDLARLGEALGYRRYWLAGKTGVRVDFLRVHQG